MKNSQIVKLNLFNGTTFKKLNIWLNTNIYSYLETSGGPIFNPFQNCAYYFSS
jgi:hypothetical protein